MFDTVSWRKLRLRCVHVSKTRPALMVGDRLLRIQSIWFDMMPPDYRSYDHEHSSYELIMFLHGNARYVDAGGKQPLAHGQVLLFAPQQKHAWHVSEMPCTRFAVSFFLEPSIEVQAPTQWPISLELAGQVEHLGHELLAANPRDLLYVASRAVTLTSQALSLFQSEKPLVAPSTRKLDLLETIQQLISRDLAHRWTQEEIAQQLGMSVRHLARSFRQIANNTLTRYIQEVRMDHVRYLLRETDEKISEICTRAGIPDHGYFYRSFQRHFGTTPNTYRKMAREDNAVK